MSIKKYKSFESAEQDLWEFNPHKDYFKRAFTLMRMKLFLKNLYCPYGVFKYKTLGRCTKRCRKMDNEELKKPDRALVEICKVFKKNKEVFHDNSINEIEGDDILRYSVIRYGTPYIFYIDLIGQLEKRFFSMMYVRMLIFLKLKGAHQGMWSENAYKIETDSSS